MSKIAKILMNTLEISWIVFNEKSNKKLNLIDQRIKILIKNKEHNSLF